jgi:CubicO group peptidase (beta-lactamase class C family)
MDGSWLFAEPGAIYSYANPGYWIAGFMCEELDHQPYAEVLSRRLFQPLGMTRTTLRPMMAMSWPLALGHEVRQSKPAIVRPQADNVATWPAGQMYSSVLDLARFTMAIMNGGRLGGQQVLHPDVVAKLTTPYVRRPGANDQYAYGLVVSAHRGIRLLQHTGSRSGYGSIIRMAPDQKVAVIVLTNRSGSSLPRTAEKALEISVPLEPPARSRTKGVPLTTQEMTNLAGTYSNHRQTVELTVEGDKLWMRRKSNSNADSGTREISKISADILAYQSGEDGQADSATNRIVVVRSADGTAEFICLSGRALRRQAK